MSHFRVSAEADGRKATRHGGLNDRVRAIAQGGGGQIEVSLYQESGTGVDRFEIRVKPTEKDEPGAEGRVLLEGELDRSFVEGVRMAIGRP